MSPTPETSVAVIGAGMAGLACARELQRAGFSVRVFDKGRGLGGRIATRRVENGAFDHGCLSVRARERGFAGYLEETEAAGAAAPWPAAQAAVGLPGMSGLVKPLAADLDIQNSAEITELKQAADGWLLHTLGGGEEGPFDRVALAIPQPQARRLVAPWPALSDPLGAVEVDPCWAALFAFETSLEVAESLILPEKSRLRALVRNSAKPGRNGSLDCWVAQAGAAWSRDHLELEKPEAAALLLAESFALLGVPPRPADYLAGHRWRYAFTARPLGEPCLLDASAGLGLCGDWCLGDDAEAAFDSGRALAAALIEVG